VLVVSLTFDMFGKLWMYADLGGSNSESVVSSLLTGCCQHAFVFHSNNSMEAYIT